MKVREAIGQLSYGTAYEIRGAYSGQIYHRSYINSSKNLDKYTDMEVTETPYYTRMILRGEESSNEWCIAIIGIWMHDYDLTKDRRTKDVSK